MTDNFDMKKLAVVPILATSNHQNTSVLLESINSVGGERFFDFVIDNRLAPLWFDYLINSGIADQIAPAIVENLKRQKLNGAALHLMQTRVMNQVHQIFEEENVPYLVFKGAGLRHTIYDDPIHRPAADIDILVNAADRTKAVACLAKAGFNFFCKKHDISHELTLSRDSVAIDLHWALLHPGRVRLDMNEYLFDNRIQSQQFWVLNNRASLFVMLMHPVFTKHLNSPFSLLIHLVDLHKLIRAEEHDWNHMIDILERAGCKTVAWCSLYWLEKITGSSAPAEVTTRLQPGYAKKQCLCFWIDRMRSERLTNIEFQTMRLFSLILHDSIRDTLFFLANHAKEKIQANRNVKALTAVYEENRSTTVVTDPGNRVNSR